MQPDAKRSVGIEHKHGNRAGVKTREFLSRISSSIVGTLALGRAMSLAGLRCA